MSRYIATSTGKLRNTKADLFTSGSLAPQPWGCSTIKGPPYPHHPGWSDWSEQKRRPQVVSWSGTECAAGLSEGGTPDTDHSESRSASLRTTPQLAASSPLPHYLALLPLPHDTTLPPLPHHTALPPIPHYSVSARPNHQFP